MEIQGTPPSLARVVTRYAPRYIRAGRDALPHAHTLEIQSEKKRGEISSQNQNQAREPESQNRSIVGIGPRACMRYARVCLCPGERAGVWCVSVGIGRSMLLSSRLLSFPLVSSLSRRFSVFGACRSSLSVGTQPTTIPNKSNNPHSPKQSATLRNPRTLLHSTQKHPFIGPYTQKESS